MGDITQLGEYLPSMHNILGSIPSTVYPGYDGKYLFPQSLGDGGNSEPIPPSGFWVETQLHLG